MTNPLNKSAKLSSVQHVFLYSSLSGVLWSTLATSFRSDVLRSRLLVSMSSLATSSGVHLLVWSMWRSLCPLENRHWKRCLTMEGSKSSVLSNNCFTIGALWLHTATSSADGRYKLAAVNLPCASFSSSQNTRSASPIAEAVWRKDHPS